MKEKLVFICVSLAIIFLLLNWYYPPNLSHNDPTGSSASLGQKLPLEQPITSLGYETMLLRTSADLLAEKGEGSLFYTPDAATLLSRDYENVSILGTTATASYLLNQENIVMKIKFYLNTTQRDKIYTAMKEEFGNASELSQGGTPPIFKAVWTYDTFTYTLNEENGIISIVLSPFFPQNMNEQKTT